MLNRDAFERLLRALGDDPQRAGEAYERLRGKLMKFFEWRGSDRPDTLADLTFDRVGRKLEEGETIRSADPAAYVYAVARNILKESWVEERRQRDAESGARDDGNEQARITHESRHRCLDRCLESMSAESRRLLLRYYTAPGSARIPARKALAQELGVPLNALRIRMHRLRADLERCIEDCLREADPEMDRPRTHLNRGRRESS